MHLRAAYCKIQRTYRRISFEDVDELAILSKTALEQAIENQNLDDSEEFSLGEYYFLVKECKRQGSFIGP